MNVKAIPMSDLSKVCDDIYTSVIIVSERAKQIVDQRFVPIDENEEVEDSIFFEEQIINLDEEEKAMIVALKEHLEGSLTWRQPNVDENIEDEL